MSLKFKGELCVIAIKNDAKCEKELTCQFKIDIGNVYSSTQKSQTFAL